MQSHDIECDHVYALRIESRAWLDDLTIAQVWAVLKAAYQPLQARQDLLFVTLLPNGEMPAKCVPKCVFELCMRTPAMLAEALSRPSRLEQASTIDAAEMAQRH